MYRERQMTPKSAQSVLFAAFAGIAAEIVVFPGNGPSGD